MKKILYLFICLFWFSVCHADLDSWMGQDIDNLDSIDGASVSGLESWAGQTIPSGGELFYWDCDVSGSDPYTPNIGTGTITENNSVSSTGTGCVGNALVTSDGSASVGALYIDSANIDLSAGQINICLIPAYSGSPSQPNYIIRETPTSGSFNFRHHTDGSIYFAYGDGQASKAWNPTSGVQYDMKITWGVNHAAVFIDTVEGTTDTSLTQPTGEQQITLSGGGGFQNRFNGTIDEVHIDDSIQ